MGHEKHTAVMGFHYMIERIYFYLIISSQKKGSEKHTADVVLPASRGRVLSVGQVTRESRNKSHKKRIFFRVYFPTLRVCFFCPNKYAEEQLGTDVLGWHLLGFLTAWFCCSAAFADAQIRKRFNYIRLSVK